MVFLDPTTDIAFKKLFGNSEHKEILISFLNSVLERADGEKIIKELEAYERYVDTIRSRASQIDTAYKEGIEKGFEKGIEKGVKRGIEQGFEQGKIEVAKKLLAISTMSIEEVAKATGLSIEIVKKASLQLDKK